MGGGGGVGSKVGKKGKVGRTDRQGVRDVATKERKEALRGDARRCCGETDGGFVMSEEAEVNT